MIRLDILSDPVCPWCYIGKAQLDRALAAAPEHPFAIAWHPFQLNPDMPRGGMDRRRYLEAKFGDRERAVEVYSSILRAAEGAGVTLDIERIGRMPNTLDAHRLIHWAGLEGRQNAIVDALFRAYFVEGRDIGDHDTLAAIAENAGLAPGLARRLLDSEADVEEVRARDARARERGVSGVPTFVIGNRHVLTGAQSPAVWAQVIDLLGREDEAASS